MSTPAVDIQDLKFAFDTTTFDFGSAQIQPGQVVVLLGPSGAGKSTLMRLLRGELDPLEGTVHITGEQVQTRKKALVLNETRAGWVPQLDDLQPMLSARENIAHHLLRLDEEEREERVDRLLTTMHLKGYDALPVRSLSGGQRQRVSIAKAMANEPPVLLMDESLAQLDLRTKTSILLDVKRMVRETQTAAILVLHDPTDALMIADELWVIRDGTLVQKGHPKTIVNQPESHAIAGLFDHINVVPRDVDIPGSWRLDGEEKWLFAHELPALEGAEVLEVFTTPSGQMQLLAWKGLELLKK
jgi:ABC-type Fe3+/spermidine/putrescine transport system ATPase subunit